MRILAERDRGDGRTRSDPDPEPDGEDLLAPAADTPPPGQGSTTHLTMHEDPPGTIITRSMVNGVVSGNRNGALTPVGADALLLAIALTRLMGANDLRPGSLYIVQGMPELWQASVGRCAWLLQGLKMTGVGTCALQGTPEIVRLVHGCAVQSLDDDPSAMDMLSGAVPNLVLGDIDLPPVLMATADGSIAWPQVGPEVWGETARLLHLEAELPEMPEDADALRDATPLAWVAAQRQATSAADFLRRVAAAHRGAVAVRLRREIEAGDRPNASGRAKAAAAAARARLLQAAEEAEEAESADFAPDLTALGHLHGCDVALDWVRDLARDLAAWRAGELAWEDVDRGALLAGPPGTGKTTLARAAARYVGIPFLPMSTTDLVDYRSAWAKGGGIADFFKQARNQSPCLVFIDEIDSLPTRGTAAHNESYYAPKVNSLLAELDGPVPRDGVVVLAATNAPERVDPALRRSGRLDRTIVLAPPSPAALERILRDRLPTLEGSVDLRPVLRRAHGATGADAERWARGARRTARRERRPVQIGDLMAELVYRATAATTDRRAAVHEVGHAIAAEVSRPGSVTAISLVRTGADGALSGNVAETLVASRDFPTRDEVDRHVVTLLAGLAAEGVVMGDHCASSGGSGGSDLALATSMLLRAELSHGLGGRLTWHGSLGSEEQLAMALRMHPEVAISVERRLRDAEATASDLLERNRPLLDSLVDQLLAHGGLTGDEVREQIAAAGDMR